MLLQSGKPFTGSSAESGLGKNTGEIKTELHREEAKEKGWEDESAPANTVATSELDEEKKLEQARELLKPTQGATQARPFLDEQRAFSVEYRKKLSNLLNMHGLEGEDASDLVNEVLGMDSNEPKKD